MSETHPIAQALFWAFTAAIIYTYFGYYAILRLLTHTRQVAVALDPNHLPSVSIIVTALNEEKSIERRIINLLELDYPKDRLEIIVGSDGSTDRTVEIASRFKDKGVVVHDFRVNRGRAAVHNDSVRGVSGEIIVFTDAETVFDKDFLLHIVKYYADPKVGAVSGSLTYLSRGNEFASAENFYFRYEKVLREMESRLGILSSGSGACFSIRRSLYRELPGTEDVDFALPIDCIKKGYLVHIDTKARAYDYPSGSVKGVFKARSRMIAKAFSGLLRLCPFGFWVRHPIVIWGIISRKIMRWCTSLFMTGALVTNIVIAGEGPVFMAALGAQTIFYGMYIMGWALSLTGRQSRIPSWVFIFGTANIGMFIGILRAVAGRVPSSYRRA